MNVRKLHLDELEQTFKCRECDRKCGCIESQMGWRCMEFRIVATCESGPKTKWHESVDEAINGWNTITTYVGD